MEKKSIFLSGIWSYGNIIFNAFISLVLVLIFSRFLDVKDYGYFVSASLIIDFLTHIGEIGISPFIIQREKIDEKIIAVSFTITFLISIFIIFILNLILIILLNYQNNSELYILLKYLSFTILSKNLSVLLNSKWFRDLNNKLITKINIFSGLVSFLISLLALIYFEPLIALIIYATSKSWIQLLVSLKVKNFKIYFLYDFKLAEEIINFGLPLILSRLISYLNIQAPKIACGFFLGPYYLGILSAAMLIIDNLHKVFLSSIWSLWMPFLSKIKRDTPKRFGEMYLRVRNMQISIIVPILFLIISLKKQIVQIAIPDKFYELENLLSVLCFAGIFIASNYLFKPSLVLIGKTKQRLFFDLFKLFLHFSLLPIFTRIDLNNLVYGMLIIEIIFFTISQYYLKSIIKKEFFDQLASSKGIFISAFSILCLNYFWEMYFINLNNWKYIVIFSSISLFCYGINLYFFDRNTFNELMNFKNYLVLKKDFK